MGDLVVKGFRPAEVGELSDIISFLRKFASESVIPLARLTNYGLDQDHPDAIKVKLRRDRRQITDIIAWTSDGFVLPCAPSCPSDVLALELQGQKVKGFFGDGKQVAGLRLACGLDVAAEIESHEPSFALEIEDLRCPEIGGYELKDLSSVSFEFAGVWRALFLMETLEQSLEQAVANAASKTEAAIAADTHRILFHNGVPVAMTGFNVNLGDLVQIGGVFTPPEYRSKGHARVAVALHLREAWLKGITHAVLSATGEAAVKAYSALGFQRRSTVSLVQFDELKVAHV